MTAMLLTPLAALAALFVAAIGAICVSKAAYIDKRALKCACGCLVYGSRHDT